MTARAAKPEKKTAPRDPLDEAAWGRILPPIDESDPEWQACVRQKVQEALDDPRPSIPADEAFAQVYAHIERRRSVMRGGD